MCVCLYDCLPISLVKRMSTLSLILEEKKKQNKCESLNPAAIRWQSWARWVLWVGSVVGTGRREEGGACWGGCVGEESLEGC